MGGAETMCEELLYRLRDTGCEVVALSLYSQQTPITERLKENGIPLLFADKKSGFDFSLIKKLRKIILEVKPDIIHTHLNAAPYAAVAVKKLNIPIVHTVHNLAEKDCSKLTRLFLKRYIKRKKIRLVALSEEIKQTILSYYKVNKEEVPFVFNGINLSKCFKKESYELNNGEFSILHVGRFFEQKNHIGLVTAFAEFVKSVPCSRLNLVGDGELKASIEEYVTSNGLSDKVKFHGTLSSAYEIMGRADIFILPSLYEGVPITLIEAMGTGLPIIASNVGGVPSMLQDEQSALLINARQDEIVNALHRLYGDKNLRENLGRGALAQSQRFSSKEMASNYFNFYENLLG